MKRRIVKLCPRILLFVLLGAIINVAVAWGQCIIRHKRSLAPLPLSGVPSPQHWRILPSINSFDRIAFKVPPELVLDFTLQTGSGWPVLSVERSALFPWNSSNVWDVWTDGLTVAAPQWLIGSDSIQLPVHPVWPGFAINTIFYAAIAWMLFAFPGVIRRRMRAHRGRCTACGYDLRGRASESNLCPECGVSASKPA